MSLSYWWSKSSVITELMRDLSTVASLTLIYETKSLDNLKSLVVILLYSNLYWQHVGDLLIKTPMQTQMWPVSAF